MKINDNLSITPKKLFQKGNIEIHRCGLSILLVENNNTIMEILHPDKIKSAGYLNFIIDSYKKNNNNEKLKQ